MAITLAFVLKFLPISLLVSGFFSPLATLSFSRSDSNSLALARIFLLTLSGCRHVCALTHLDSDAAHPIKREWVISHSHCSILFAMLFIPFKGICYVFINILISGMTFFHCLCLVSLREMINARRLRGVVQRVIRAKQDNESTVPNRENEKNNRNNVLDVCEWACVEYAHQDKMNFSTIYLIFSQLHFREKENSRDL